MALLAWPAAADERLGSQTLELSFDHAYARLGSRELRWGGTAGIEWGRPSRIIKFRGREDILPQETLSVKFLASYRYGEGFRAALLNFGGRWIGAGASLTDWYFEFGSGVLFADETVFDLNSSFNFASYIGIGYFIDEHPNASRLGLRLMHISNGGTKPPNRSINLIQGVIGIRF